jgi:hypothetical protein
LNKVPSNRGAAREQSRPSTSNKPAKKTCPNCAQISSSFLFFGTALTKFSSFGSVFCEIYLARPSLSKERDKIVRKEKAMAGKNTAAYGIYPNVAALENGIDALQNAGFRNEDISALFPENEGTKDFAHRKGTKAPEGAATGAGTGAVAGGVLGWLAGIGAIAIPGVGPFIAAGPIMAALAGAGVGGTVGGLTGALVGAGIPEYEAKRYEGRIKDGGILVSVHCDNSEWTSKAKDVLERTGAEDVSSTGEASADFAKTDKPLPRDV